MGNIKRNNLKLLLYLFILLAIFLVGYTLAKFKTTLASSDTTKVGKFVVKNNIEQSFNIDISDIDPDNPVTYSFYISNYDSVSRAEVNIDYKITLINTYNNLPLTYSLTKINSNNNLLDENNSCSDELLFNKDEKIEYVLTIGIKDNSYEYADIVDEVTLNIEAVQRD